MNDISKKEFQDICNQLSRIKTETQTVEVKTAQGGTPEKLYDTFSSFSNQDQGGLIIFGIDERKEFEQVGVTKPAELQKHISEKGLAMEPVVRPDIQIFEQNGNVLVSAKIHGIEYDQRPCYYKARGKEKGSYIRVGDSDEHMTSLEIYNYEAYKKRIRNDIRTIEDQVFIDQKKLDHYLSRKKAQRTNLAQLEEEQIYELLHVKKDGKFTLSALLMFGIYPQAVFPQLSLTAVKIPGTQYGQNGISGERFLDNKKFEGTLEEMLEGGLNFVISNSRTKTVINKKTGVREDIYEYPVVAVREALLNALVHRDYSSYTENMPVQIRMFDNRLEIHSPGGLYGTLTVEQLGTTQPDTRNPALVTMMETVNLTENRYSGIPTIRKEMKDAKLPEPEFENKRGTFIVSLFNDKMSRNQINDTLRSVLEFCEIPRSKKEISEKMGIKTESYVKRTYIDPLLEKGLLEMTIPAKPGSRKQKYQKAE